MTHEPIDGRPWRGEPVRRKSWAGAWLNWSVYIELHDAHLVRDAVEVRNGVRHPDSALAVLLEGARGAHELGRALGEGELLALEEVVGAVLAAALHQLGFVVEKVEVGRGSGAVDVDHAPGPGGKVGSAGVHRVGREGGPGEPVGAEGGERDPAEADLAISKEVPARDVLEVSFVEGHGSGLLEELVEVENDVGDDGPRREVGEVGLALGLAEGIGGHRGGGG